METSDSDSVRAAPAAWRGWRGWRGRRRWHWGWLLVAAFCAVVTLTLAIRGGRWAAARWGGVTGGAQWIWLAHERRAPQPVAFYLARDFSLAAAPARARLLVEGDHEYVLYLNGQRVGAGGWLPGDRVDVYEVASLLQSGGNRLVAELRSADGGGGFLASLVDGSGQALVVTDGRWRAFARHRLGLVRGWLPVSPFGSTGAARANTMSAAGAGQATLAWGRPPIGRWGRITPGWKRPLFDQLTGGRQPAYAARTVPFEPPAVSGVEPDATMQVFDWGREVTGYLELETGFEPGLDPDLVPSPPDRLRTALVWTGDQPPQPIGTAEEPSAELVLMPSAHLWLDARLRHFRYALVIGLRRPLAARVYEAVPAVVAAYRLPVGQGSASAGWRAGEEEAEPVGDAVAGTPPPRPGAVPRRGVFGLPPPPLATPVQDEIRRKLKSLASVARGKEL